MAASAFTSCQWVMVTCFSTCCACFSSSPLPETEPLLSAENEESEYEDSAETEFDEPDDENHSSVASSESSVSSTDSSSSQESDHSPAGARDALGQHTGVFVRLDGSLGTLYTRQPQLQPDMYAAIGAPPSPTQSRAKKPVVVSDPPKFDLESYVANYSGRTRFERLILIGTCSTYLAPDALKLAIKEAKAGKDVRRYISAQAHLESVGPQEEEAVRDRVWIETTEKRNQGEAARLEAELKGYKNNLVKESIRIAQEELACHLQATGELSKAFEAFSKMRQDVSVTKQIIDISKHLIEVAIEQGNWGAVTSHTQKIRGLLSPSEEDKLLLPYLSACEGLAYLDAKEYHVAAHRFLQCETGIGPKFNTIITPNDIAVYGGLCALATMDRNELQTQVLENSSFRTYLELEAHIRRAITFFVNSKYTACLEVLESYRTDYLLDIHLQKHFDDLYQLVRSKSIVQYFIPFSKVTLDELNKAFMPPGKSIEKELVQMIMRKELNARIDTIDRVLIAVPTNTRAELQMTALRTADEYGKEARRRILHMNIVAADLEIKGRKGQQGLGGLGGVVGMDDYFEGGMIGGREPRPRNPHGGGF